MDRPIAISTHGLTKRYGPILALDNLDLEVPAGSITGLLGPSGSGRTTLLRLLAGLAHPTSGSAVVAGVALDDRYGVQLRRRIGVLPASDGIYEWMTGREQVSFAAELAGIGRTDIPERVDDVLERLDLRVLADARTGLYDRAQRRRLGLAQSLIAQPEVLLLDEPASSLDPTTTNELLSVIGGLRDLVTVVLSTAEPAHVEAVCDRVAVLETGRLLASSPVDALLEGVTGTNYTISVDGYPGLAFAGLVARLRREPWVRTAEIDGLVLHVSVRDVERASRELLPAVVATGVPVASFRRERPTLADAVHELFGGAAARIPADAETVA